MEDSAKRRERLQAMRSAASAAGSGGGAPPSEAPGQPLPNPLSFDSAESPSGGSRFDFYTDPMSAFSSAKRRRGGFSSSPGTPSFRPSYPVAGQYNYRGNMAHPSAHQFPVGQSPDHTSSEMLSDVFQSNQMRTPAQYPNFPPGSGVSPANSEVWNVPGGTSAHAFAPNMPRSSFAGPSGRPGNYMHSPGRGNYMQSPGRGNFMQSPGRGNFMDSPGRGNPHFQSRRGRGGQYPGSSSPTWGSGRGRSSSYMQHSGGQGAQSYYIKAMVKDPWRKLTPTVGNILLGPRGDMRSPLPQSLVARSADVKGTQSNPRFNLAEYLAQSFEEASSET